MTALIPGLSVIGDFILLPTGSTALHVRHIALLDVTGREDPDHPHVKNIQLNASVSGPEPEPFTSYVLGRFETFFEAKNAMEHLLKRIGDKDEDGAT